MSTLLLAAGRGGPPLDFVLPRVRAHADAAVLFVAPPGARDLEAVRDNGCAVVEGVTVSGPTGIVGAAETVGADGLLTLSEYAVLAVAEAAVKLGLPGPGPGAVNARGKFRMRMLWRLAGVPVPDFFPVASADDLRAAAQALPSPFLLKSAWGAGSIGQRIVHRDGDLDRIWSDSVATIERAAVSGRADWSDEAAEPGEGPAFLAEAIIRATTASWYEPAGSPPSGWGDYVSVEGVVAGGVYHPVCVTSRLPTIEPFTELANLCPCPLPEQAQRALEDQARQAVDALGLETCGTHTEIKLGPDGTVMLLESAARLPGALLTREIEEVWGVDLIGAVTRLALGADASDAGLPPSMLVGGARKAAATVALLATDSSGAPWTTLPAFVPDRIDWKRGVAAGTTVEVVESTAIAAGSPMPAYRSSDGTMNFAGLAFVTAPDPKALLAGTYRILDSLEELMTSAAAGDTDTVQFDHTPPTVEEVVDLFQRAPLNGPLDEPDRMQAMLDRAPFHCSARIDGRLVGYVRVLTDFSFNAFVADLAVHPDLQGRGIGRALLERATDPWPGVKFVVMPGEDSAGFYSRAGFVPAPTCMLRGRSR